MFCQVVSKQQEPLIVYQNATKRNKKQSEDDRFVVATCAALYLCKVTAIGRSLKICKKFAWVDLLSFEMRTDESFCFKFHNETVILAIVDNNQFLTRVLSYLRFLLPENHNVDIEIPKGISLESVHLKRNTFVDLFISFCHSLYIPVDMELVKHFDYTLKEKLPLEISKKLFSDGIIRAMCGALKYCTSVPQLIIGGNKFPDLYNVLREIFDLNHTINTLTIRHCKKTDGFRHFVKVLIKAPINELNFERVVFNDKMVRILTKVLPNSALNKIAFIECSSKDICEPLFAIANNCKQLKSLQIVKDKTVFDSQLVPPLFTFIVIAEITSIDISNTATDIAEVFSKLSNTEMALERLVLAGNRCSSSYDGKAILPKSLVYLDLSDVKWEGGSLTTLFDKQVMNQIELNLSRTRLDNDKMYYNFFTNLPRAPPSNMIIKLFWEMNPISYTLLEFFGNLKFLQELSISKCKFIKTESQTGLYAISQLLTHAVFIKFSAEKVFSKDPGFLETLQPVFASQQSIQKIDISRNKIKEDSLDTIVAILTQNKQIKYFNFDGTHVRDVNSYIAFLNNLAEIPHLRRIAKPKRDLKRFEENLQNNKQKVDRLKKAWSKVSELGTANARKCNEEDSNASNHYSFAADSQSMTDSNVNDPPLTIEWEVKFQSNYHDDERREEWTKLRQQFSYASILSL